MNSYPIGIIDSGVGGLSILREVRELCPFESMLYLCDQKNVPYGSRNPSEIFHLARKMIIYLIKREVKLIIIACNVISVTSLGKLRKEFKDVTFIGTVPVIKVAALKTKVGRIGVLSTLTTAKSSYNKELIKKFAQDKKVVVVGTDKLVPFIEKGEVSGKRLRKILELELYPFIEMEIDTLTLACTHFPFISEEISNILGKKVLILDSSVAVARNTALILGGRKNKLDEKPIYEYITSGNAEITSTITSKLLAKNIKFSAIVL